MAEVQPERFFLEVLTGADKGVTCWVNPEQSVVLGSSPNAGLVLQDESVKAEHAVVSLLKGRLWLENLSSSGTQLNGRLVRDRTVITVGEVIGLGDDAKVALRSTARRTGQSSSLVLPLLLLIVVAGGILLAVLTAAPRAERRQSRPITAEQWERAYQRLQKRLAVWTEEGRLPPQYREAFTQAWYRDRGGDTSGARQQWKRMYNALVGLSVPGATPPGRTIASGADASADDLHVLMGRDPNRDPDNSLMWTGDDAAYASAWWWFVNSRLDEFQDRK